MSVLVRRLLILFVALALFVGTPLLNLLGYAHAQSGGSFLSKIHPATYAILLAFGIYIYRMRYHLDYILKYKLNYVTTLAVILFIVFILLSSGRGNSMSFMADTLLAAIFFAIVYPAKDDQLHARCLRIVLLFYVINCLIAVYEKSFDTNILPAKGIQYFGFRASALQGHPLNNALMTVTIMAFIYVCDVKYKYPLLLLGFVSLVCFGARGALYGVVGCTLLFAFTRFIFNYRATYRKRKTKLTSLFTGLFVFFSLFFLFYLITATKFGGRLTSVSFYDEGSAGARLDVLKIFRFFKEGDILWGAKQNQIDMATLSTGVLAIENFWIVWLLRFGAVLLVVLMIFLIRTMYKQLSTLKKIERLYILGVFFVVASSNNSLATNTMALNVFFICSFAFRPGVIKSKKIRTHS